MRLRMKAVAAVGAVFAMAEDLRASDACIVDAGILVCAGDQSDGVQALVDPAYPVVVAPVGSITPATGVQGINVSFPNVNLELDVTATIVTNQAYGMFIQAYEWIGSQADISFTGDVTSTDSAGLFVSLVGVGGGAVSVGSLTLKNDGVLTSLTEGYGALFANVAGIADNTMTGVAVSSTGSDISVETRDVTAAGGNTAVWVTQSMIASDWHGEQVTAIAGDTSVTSTGMVQVGNVSGSTGIRAESSAIAVGFGDADSEAGDVTIVAKDVIVGGDFSYGIQGTTSATAQTEPGMGTTHAVGGTVLIETSGAVEATGSSSVAIQGVSFVNSVDSQVQGEILIDILGGHVLGGSGSGSAIQVSGQAIAEINNAGTVSALSGMAVQDYTDGGAVINNAGLMIGNIDSFGQTSVNNSGVFETGSFISAGQGFSNTGQVSPGGDGVISGTIFSGDFTQSSTGQLVIDANWNNGLSDEIIVSGVADLAGTVVVIPENFPTQGGLTTTFYVMHAVGGMFLNGLAAVDTATVDYELEQFGSDLYLNATINFMGIGVSELDANQSAIAQSVNAIVMNGGAPGFDPVMLALLGLGTQVELESALDQLSPQIYAYQAADTLQGAETFGDELLSCRKSGSGAASIAAEGECVWARVKARRTDMDATANALGSRSEVWGFSGGAQVSLAPRWRLGFAGGYESVDLQSGAFASGDGTRVHAGTALKYIDGAFSLTGTVSGGLSDYDTERRFNFGGFAGTGEGRQDVDYVSGALQASYVEAWGSAYVKPLVEGRITRLEADGFEETGGGGAGLTVSGFSETFISVSPALEVGANHDMGSGMTWRPYVRGGVSWRNEDVLAVGAGFGAAPGSGFVVATALDDVLAEVNAGFDLISAGGGVLRLEGDGRFGDKSESYGASLKGSLPF